MDALQLDSLRVFPCRYLKDLVHDRLEEEVGIPYTYLSINTDRYQVLVAVFKVHF